MRDRTSLMLGKLCLLLGIALLPLLGIGQSAYVFQKDDSVLKRNYYQQSLKKKEMLLAGLKKPTASDYQKIYEGQFKEIGEIWQSSRSITAPKSHQYLQSVVQQIIKANTVLSGTDARVVFSRDWWPNAFSMGEGTIAINAGLMIYFRNEAELAFVVSHELAHYYLGHTTKSIDKYVATVNSKEYQDELKRLSKLQYRTNQFLDEMGKSVIFNRRQHSRTNEAEADRQAFIFMKNAGYDCNAIRTCLELLDKVDDSLVSPPLNLKESFSFTDYAFKNKWTQQESAIFSQLDENSNDISKKERDSLKTHPDCSKRIALLADSISHAGDGASYIVNETVFSELKDELMLEMTEQCYQNKRLSRQLYYSLLLLQSDRHKNYAIYSTARCLNQLYINQREHKLGLTIDTEEKAYRDDYNLLLRMLNRVRLEELGSIAYYFCKKYEPQMKDNAGFIQEMRIAQNHPH